MQSRREPLTTRAAQRTSSSRTLAATAMMPLLGMFLGLGACGGPRAAEPERRNRPAPQTKATKGVRIEKMTETEVRALPGGGTGAIQANYGSIKIEAGFTPDPRLLPGTSGGTENAAALAAGCSGWISGELPDHILIAGTPLPKLRVLAASNQDVTLVIQRVGGGYACNDDAEGSSPEVKEAFPLAGIYRIWVGSFEKGINSAYQLVLTENPGTTAAGVLAAAAQPRNDIPSNFGTIALAPGFAPDPITTAGTAGGTLNANTLSGGCSGWIAAIPDHVLSLAAPIEKLRILAHASSDVTLITQGPDGQYVCTDDAEGTNPILEGAFKPGSYKVWIGAFQQGQTAAYRLGVTTSPTVTAASLAAN